MDLDSLDRKILYALGENARSSYKQLARRISSKKPTVAYRVQGLLEKRLVWKFVPVISLRRLGLHGYKMYVRLQGMDKNQKAAMISDLADTSQINWVAETTGMWDLMWSVISASIEEFAEQKNTFFRKYGTYVQDYAVTVLEDALVFNRDYLIDEAPEYRKSFAFGGEPEHAQIDEVQKEILHAIKNDGKYQVTDLAEQLGINVRTVMSRLSDMQEKNVIQGYTTFVDIQKLGLQFFKLCVYFQKFHQRRYEELLSFCKSNPNVIHLIKSIGQWDLEVELEAEEIGDIYAFIENIKTEFPELIKKVDVSIIKQEHKLDFLPELF